jgi:hypothetical protein
MGFAFFNLLICRRPMRVCKFSVHKLNHYPRRKFRADFDWSRRNLLSSNQLVEFSHLDGAVLWHH